MVAVTTTWTVTAQETPPTDEALVLAVDGTEGVWMPLDMARRVQLDAERVPPLKLTVTSLELQLDVRGERLRNCQTVVDQAAKQVESAERKVINLEAKYESWYYKPGVWVGVGIVILMIVEVAAVSTVKALK